MASTSPKSRSKLQSSLVHCCTTMRIYDESFITYIIIYHHISSYILYISSTSPLYHPLYILYIVHNYRAFLSSFWMAVGVKAELWVQTCLGNPWKPGQREDMNGFRWQNLSRLDEIVTPCAKGPAAKACMESVLAPDFSRKIRQECRLRGMQVTEVRVLRWGADWMSVIRFSHYDQIPIPNWFDMTWSTLHTSSQPQIIRTGPFALVA